MTFEEKDAAIIKACMGDEGTDTLKISNSLMRMPEISVLGPEHHFLAAASLLSAYEVAGGKIDLATSLDMLKAKLTLAENATCADFPTCGVVKALSAALQFIPSVTAEDQKAFEAAAASALAALPTPRCCKLCVYTALSLATDLVNTKEGLAIPHDAFECPFFSKNPTCIKEQCSYYPAPSTTTVTATDAPTPAGI